MKKLSVLLLLLVASYFGLQKWSPGTLERIKGRSAPSQKAANVGDPQHDWIPAPEPPPTGKPPESTPATQPAASPNPASTSPAATTNVDKTAQVVTLCYHRVEGPAGGALSISPELFEQHMQRLRDNGIKVISMQDFLAWRRNEKSIPAKSALITIDDGYVSAYEVARPILKKFGYPWTYFIYTKYIASGGKSVTWEQLASLRDEGVEIGCHTVSHLSLRETRGKSPEAYEAWLRDEILGSKQIIEKHLSIKCSVFAYPEGRYNAKVLDLIKEAGFGAAFTVYGQRITHGAPSDRIGRYAWYSRRPQDTEMALNFAGPVSAAESESPVAAELAAAMMVTQPMHGETVSDPGHVLKANLSSFGAFDDATLTMSLSGEGPIPFKFDPQTRMIEAKPPHALKSGEHSVTISARAKGKRVETHWAFRVDPHGGLNAPLESFSAVPPPR